MSLKPPRTIVRKKSLIQHKRCGQRLSKDGRIIVSKKGWIARITTLVGITLVIAHNLYQGLQLRDPLVAYSTLMPIHALLVFAVGWIFFRSRAKGKVGNSTVSVIIPVYNQDKKAIISEKADIYTGKHNNIQFIY